MFLGPVASPFKVSSLYQVPQEVSIRRRGDVGSRILKVLIGLGSDVAEYVREGVLTPLTEHADRTVAVEDFWPPAWQGVVYEGEVYGLPAWVDPNFALLANRQLFAEAGLNTDSPPKDIAELEEAMEKLTKRTGDDRITQLGMAPWQVYGPYNTLVTWAWSFGARTLYDVDNRLARFDALEVVNSQAWVADKFQRYSGNLEGIDQFVNGHLGMELITGGTNIRRSLEAIPDLMSGVTPAHADAGTDSVAWVGGHIAVVPYGAHNVDRAWEFIQFISGTSEGAAAWAKNGRISGFRDADAISTMREDRAMDIMLNVLEKASFIRPRIPVASLDTVVAGTLQEIWRGDVAPKIGMGQLNELLQAQVDAYHQEQSQ